MVSSSIGLILTVVLIIVAFAVFIIFIMPYFGFSIMGMITQPPNLNDVFNVKDFTEADVYSGFDLTYDGMILLRDGGEDSVADELKSYESVSDCSGCSSCSPKSLGTVLTTGCDSCSVCDEIDEPGRFKNCLGCEGGNCMFCDDTSEYELCKEIKSCILEYAGDKSYKELHGCFLRQIPHNDGTSFDINDLKQVLASCKDESITINTGNDFVKELCYFDADSISFYDVNRPDDFYMKYDMTASIIASGSSGFRGVLESEDLVPFYKEGAETVDRYKVYIFLAGAPDTIYTIMGGYRGTVDKEFEMVTTDSDGHWNGEIYFPEDWKNEVDRGEGVNKFNYVWVQNAALQGAVYLKNPESGYVWSHDLRFSKCNFEYDPEPYLDQKPWWVTLDQTESPLTTNQGNPDSSIKVFYDPGMPGGGNSDLRGNIKLQLGRLDTDFQRNCKFDIYVCSQDAFAEHEEEQILTLSEFLTNFDPSYTNRIISLSNYDIILYNYFELDMDKGYTPDEIRSAIKSGFRMWEQTMFTYSGLYATGEWIGSNNNDGIYEGVWDDRNIDIGYNNDCWSPDVQELMKDDSRFVVGNCKDTLCAGKLKIRIAFKYRDPLNSGGLKQVLYPTITFCDSGTEAPEYEEPPYEGLIGGCEELSNSESPFTSNLCQYGWGAGRCSGTQCVCDDGTRTPISIFKVFNNNDGSEDFGLTYGCNGTVSGNKERIVGGCVLSMNQDSTTTLGCKVPPEWGNTNCNEDGSNSECTASDGANLKYMSTNYMLNSYIHSGQGYSHNMIATKTSAGSKRLLGTCMIKTTIELGMMSTCLRTDYCMYTWGAASCILPQQSTGWVSCSIVGVTPQLCQCPGGGTLTPLGRGTNYDTLYGCIDYSPLVV